MWPLAMFSLTSSAETTVHQPTKLLLQIFHLWLENKTASVKAQLGCTHISSICAASQNQGVQRVPTRIKNPAQVPCYNSTQSTATTVRVLNGVQNGHFSWDDPSGLLWWPLVVANSAFCTNMLVGCWIYKRKKVQTQQKGCTCCTADYG